MNVIGEFSYHDKLTMPKAMVDTRHRRVELCFWNSLCMCVFVASVRDAWYMPTLSFLTTDLHSISCTLHAEPFVVVYMIILGVVAPFSMFTIPDRSFCIIIEEMMRNVLITYIYCCTHIQAVRYTDRQENVRSV